MAGFWSFMHAEGLAAEEEEPQLASFMLSMITGVQTRVIGHGLHALFQCAALVKVP